jgi:NAD(P)-dependent dehydrogenase (short-subunit alcohol dehydrogenase family)
MTGYSASKAAAHSLTQALHAILAARGMTVHGVDPGGIDTQMLAGIDAPTTAPAQVAAGLLDGRPEGVRARVLRRGRGLRRVTPGPTGGP